MVHSKARDRAILFAQRLFGLLFKRIWLPFEAREEKIISNLIDLIIEAAAERLSQQSLDELAQLAQEGERHTMIVNYGDWQPRTERERQGQRELEQYMQERRTAS